jgi:hypothetical protein
MDPWPDKSLRNNAGCVLNSFCRNVVVQRCCCNRRKDIGSEYQYITCESLSMRRKTGTTPANKFRLCSEPISARKQPGTHIGLRSYIRLSRALVKPSLITSSDVSTHFRPGPKSRLGDLTFAEAPLSAISRSSWSPESTEARAAVQSAS